MIHDLNCSQILATLGLSAYRRRTFILGAFLGGTGSMASVCGFCPWVHAHACDGRTVGLSPLDIKEQ